jgi:hypothetical protein
VEGDRDGSSEGGDLPELCNTVGTFNPKFKEGTGIGGLREGRYSSCPQSAKCFYSKVVKALCCHK